jgi:cystathionine beta-lyase/cystathionine gamma-synthase
MSYDESLVLSAKGGRYQYNRSSSNNSVRLCQLLAQRYGVTKCFLVPSGMSAIYTTIHSVLGSCQSKKINIIYGDELYCDTPKSITYLSAGRSDICQHVIDITKTKSILTLFEKLSEQFNILFVEACTNPSGYIMDYSIIPQLRKLSSQLIVIVDNTWLTEYIFNPFEHGADLVVTSLTKYYSGGCAIGGAILCPDRPDQLAQSIEEHIKRTGLHVSPHNAQVVTERLSTMDSRINHSSKTTIDVLKQLESNPQIVSIVHTAINTHPSHQMAERYFKRGLWPSVFTIYVNTPKDTALKAMRSSKLIEHKTSFGCRLSRTDPWPQTFGQATMCRISIGYEDSPDTISMAINNLVEIMTHK